MFSDKSSDYIKALDTAGFTSESFFEYRLEEAAETKLYIPLEKNSEDKKTILYNSVTKTYDPITLTNIKTPTSCGYKYPIDFKNNVKLPEKSDLFIWQYKKYQNINLLGPVFMQQQITTENSTCKPKPKLGFSEICELHKLALEIHLPTSKAFGSGLDTLGNQKGMTYFGPEAEGRVKFYFLRLGIDENNNLIKNDSKLYKAHKELVEICNSKNHPWSDKYAKKEQLLQYQLAKIFKNNTELFEITKKIANKKVKRSYTDDRGEKQEYETEKSIGVKWQKYQSFIQSVANQKYYRDKKGKQLYTKANVLPYILGAEQIMAYLLTNEIHDMWSDFLDNDPSPYITDYTTEHIIDGQKYSLISIWQKLVEIMLKNTSEKHFVSMAEHGFVISFDSDIIQLQVKNVQNNLNLFLKLKCAIIESDGSIGEDKFPSLFYRRARKETEPWPTIRKERAAILMAQELTKQAIIVLKTNKDLEQITTDLNKLKTINDSGKKLSDKELKSLKTLQEQLASYKAGAEARQKIMARKIESSFAQHKKKKQKKLS